MGRGTPPFDDETVLILNNEIVEGWATRLLLLGEAAETTKRPGSPRAVSSAEDGLRNIAVEPLRVETALHRRRACIHDVEHLGGRTSPAKRVGGSIDDRHFGIAC